MARPWPMANPDRWRRACAKSTSISHAPRRSRNAERLFVVGRQFRAVVGDEHGEQARRFRRAGVLADEVFTAGRLEESLARFVNLGGSSCGILRTNLPRQHIDEHAPGVAMADRFVAGGIADDDGSEALAGHVRQLLAQKRLG